MSSHSQDIDSKRVHVQQWMDELNQPTDHIHTPVVQLQQQQQPQPQIPSSNKSRNKIHRKHHPSVLETSQLDQEFIEQQQREYERARSRPTTGYPHPPYYAYSEPRHYSEYYSQRNWYNQSERMPPNGHDIHSHYNQSAPPTYNTGKNQYHPHSPPQNNINNFENFYFKPRREKLNWRILNSIDVEKLMDEVDIETLESITKNITFAKLDYNDMRYFTEENFVQLFRMSQLIIEYLLYVQNYLESKRKSMESDVQVILSDLDKCRTMLVQKNDEVNYLKKELKRKKKLAYAYQVVFGANPEKVKMMLQGMRSGMIPDVRVSPMATSPDKKEVLHEPINKPDPSFPLEEIQSQMKRIEQDLMNKIEQKEMQSHQILQRELSKFSESVLTQQGQVLQNLATSHGNTNGSNPLRDSTVIRQKVQEELKKHEQASRATILRAIEEKLQDFRKMFEGDRVRRSIQESDLITKKLDGVESMMRIIQDRLDKASLNTSLLSNPANRTSLQRPPSSLSDKVPTKPLQQIRPLTPVQPVVSKKIVVPPKDQTPVQSRQIPIEQPNKKIEQKKVQTTSITPKKVQHEVKPKEETKREISPAVEQISRVKTPIKSVESSVSESADSEQSSDVELLPGLKAKMILDTYDPNQPYQPDADKDYIRSQFFYHVDELNMEKEENREWLEQELEHYQIDSEAPGLNKELFSRGMLLIEQERAEDEEINDMVEELRRALDSIADQHFRYKRKKKSTIRAPMVQTAEPMIHSPRAVREQQKEVKPEAEEIEKTISPRNNNGSRAGNKTVVGMDRKTREKMISLEAVQKQKELKNKQQNSHSTSQPSNPVTVPSGKAGDVAYHNTNQPLNMEDSGEYETYSSDEEYEDESEYETESDVPSEGDADTDQQRIRPIPISPRHETAVTTSMNSTVIEESKPTATIQSFNQETDEYITPRGVPSNPKTTVFHYSDDEDNNKTVEEDLQATVRDLDEETEDFEKQFAALQKQYLPDTREQSSQPATTPQVINRRVIHAKPQSPIRDSDELGGFVKDLQDISFTGGDQSQQETATGKSPLVQPKTAGTITSARNMNARNLRGHQPSTLKTFATDLGSDFGDIDDISL